MTFNEVCSLVMVVLQVVSICVSVILANINKKK